MLPITKRLDGRRLQLLCVAYAIPMIMMLILIMMHKQQLPFLHLQQHLDAVSKQQQCTLIPTLSKQNMTQRTKCIPVELLEHYSLPHHPFVNLHQYTFIISSDVCAKEYMHVVFVVHSKPSNYHRRRLIRMSYGSVELHHDKLLTLVFLMGVVSDVSLQRGLEKESDLFGDIVQGNFIDSYRNLSLKHVMGMHWFTKNCKADFIMKLDDDTFVNPYRLLEFLAVLPNDDATIYCKASSNEDTPDRNPSSRTYTPYYQYPFKYFPPFCLGFAYITTPNAWNMLYQTSAHYKPLYVDDVFVTGILASMSGVARSDISEVMYECQEHLEKFSLELLRQSIVVLDRWNKCGDQPFQHWRNLTHDLSPGPQI